MKHLRLLIIALMLVIGSGCGTKVVLLSHPTTKETGRCSLVWGFNTGITQVVNWENCILDFEKRGYVEVERYWE